MTKDSGTTDSALPAAAKPEAAGHHPPSSWNNADAEILAFPPTGHGTSSHFGRNDDGTTVKMMGSVLRRKKVVSMPGVGTEGERNVDFVDDWRDMIQTTTIGTITHLVTSRIIIATVRRQLFLWR
jgi:hypothetical protein